MAYDVIFLSYQEQNIEEKWAKFKERFPHAKHVHGVDGILEAHMACARKAFTSHFFVVDADNEILDFDFEYQVDEHRLQYVHLWHARNPVNGLEYGWGGVKLFPKKLLRRADDLRTLDMTTSFPLHIIPETISVTNFADTPFDAWRSGFREAVKLSISTTTESADRLNVWLTNSIHGENANWVEQGVKDGILFSKSGKSLTRINFWDVMQDTFLDVYIKKTRELPYPRLF